MGRLIVLGGGTSDERDVSLRSSAEVIDAIKSLGLDVEFFDPKVSDDYLSAGPEDIVLPILHGKFGEDGTLQRELEARSIPFLGADSQSSEKSFDKWQTRQILEANGIPVPEGAFINFEEYQNHTLAVRPHVIKLTDGGSSIGTHIIREPEKQDIGQIRQFFGDQKMVVEQLIEGIETTVSILDKTALPVVEIHPPTDGEFDYENKYNGATKEICPPASLGEPMQKEIQALAEKVHHVMGCRHFSRVDIMVDNQPKLYVLEINTIPGLTAQSLYPRSAGAAGISMEQLVMKLIELVARDYSLKL